jgi:hypothetical protein
MLGEDAGRPGPSGEEVLLRSVAKRGQDLDSSLGRRALRDVAAANPRSTNSFSIKIVFFQAQELDFSFKYDVF